MHCLEWQGTLDLKRSEQMHACIQDPFSFHRVDTDVPLALLPTISVVMRLLYQMADDWKLSILVGDSGNLFRKILGHYAYCSLSHFFGHGAIG